MSYRSLSNPYSQPPRPTLNLSVEESLKQMIRLEHPPSAVAVLPIIDHISQSTDSISWDQALVEGLTLITLRCLDCLIESSANASLGPSNVSEGSLATLFMMTLAMDDWSDECMYNALSQRFQSDDSRISLLEAFVRLATGGTDTVHRLAFIGIATAFRSMDRLDRYLTLDVSRPDLAWWLDCVTEASISMLSGAAVSILLR